MAETSTSTTTTDPSSEVEAAAPSPRPLDADDLRAVSVVLGIPLRDLQLMVAQDNATGAWQRTRKY
jgi:hypothetical protein